LENVGYDVGETFRTNAAHGQGFAHREDWPDHVLQVDASSGNGSVALSVVRVGGPALTNADKEEDERIEHELCADLDRISQEAGEAGVPMAFPARHRVEPGSESVPAIDRETLRYLEMQESQ
jgi:hypothetical protein